MLSFSTKHPHALLPTDAEDKKLLLAPTSCIDTLFPEKLILLMRSILVPWSQAIAGDLIGASMGFCADESSTTMFPVSYFMIATGTNDIALCPWQNLPETQQADAALVGMALQSFNFHHVWDIERQIVKLCYPDLENTYLDFSVFSDGAVLSLGGYWESEFLQGSSACNTIDDTRLSSLMHTFLLFDGQTAHDVMSFKKRVKANRVADMVNAIMRMGHTNRTKKPSGMEPFRFALDMRIEQ